MLNLSKGKLCNTRNQFNNYHCIDIAGLLPQEGWVVYTVLDFRAEGLSFETWIGHGDCTLGQETLHMCVPLHPGVQTVVGEITLQHAGILFSGVLQPCH